MKQHILSLFAPVHCWWTISFFLLAVLLIVACIVMVAAGHYQGYALSFAGMIFLFLSLVHTWRKEKNFVIMSVVFACIYFGIHLILIIYKLASTYINHGMPVKPTNTENFISGIVAVLLWLICVPGIIVGVFGILYWIKRKN